jgi:phosphohistidine phosphatase
MARTLVLVRHAKSEAEGPTDAARTLARRGQRDARAVGRWLEEQGVAPDRVVVSPAVRARQTWERAAAALADAPDPDIDDRIYENEEDALLQVINETPDDVQTLVLVGHNPSFAALAYDLDDGGGDSEARQELLAGFPTSATAVFETPGDWADVRPRSLRLVAFAAPRG